MSLAEIDTAASAGLRFIDAGIVVSDPPLTHDSSLLSGPHRTDSDAIPVFHECVGYGCACHPNAGLITVREVEASYDAIERYVEKTCPHPDCTGRVCLRINANHRETKEGFHRLGISRESKLKHGGENIFIGEQVRIFPSKLLLDDMQRA